MNTTNGGRVLVTGATGFTGGHLARSLQRRGYAVRALARNPAQPAAEALQQAGIEVVKGDLTDSRDVHTAVRNCRDVYHIAALYRSARHGARAYWRVNVQGTENVLAAAREHGCRRVVHCSTAGVHGEIDAIPADETSPLKPGDIYQQTKLEGERAAQRAIADGLPGVVVRPVGIYGPEDTRFLKLFRAIHTGRFRMIGPGDVMYHLTYIDDLIDGIILAGESPEGEGQTYLLAGPRYTTIHELAQQVAMAVERPLASRHLPLAPVKAAATACEYACRSLRIEPPLHRRRLDFFTKDRAFTSDKAKREIGYSPRVDLAEGLRRTAQWYFDHGYLHRAPEAPIQAGSPS
jgi:nucleoside-diphosphate-sugar epimerase